MVFQFVEDHHAEEQCSWSCWQRTGPMAEDIGRRGSEFSNDVKLRKLPITGYRDEAVRKNHI
jgi:hypothetical protein